MSSNVARRLNITPRDDQYIILLAANGEQMHVDGHALIMTSSQGVDTLVDAIISPHMQVCFLFVLERGPSREG